MNMKMTGERNVSLFFHVMNVSFCKIAIFFSLFTGSIAVAQDTPINWMKELPNTNRESAFYTLASIVKKRDLVNGQLVEVPGFVGVGYVSSENKTFPGYKGGTSDIWFANFSESGEIISSIALGGSNTEVGQTIVSTNDGGYIITGRTNSNDGDVSGWHEGYHPGGERKYDYWIIKIKDEKIQWQKTFGTEGEEYHNCFVREVRDGSFIVAGTISKSAFGSDIGVMNLSSKGELVWEKTYGTAGRTLFFDMVYTVQYNTEYITILGHGARDVSKQDGICLFQILASEGKEIWDGYYGSPNDRGVSLVTTPDEGFLITGTKGGFPYDYFIIRTNGIGGVRPWIRQTYGGTKSDAPVKVKVNKDGTYTILGYTFSNDGDIMGFHPNKEGKEAEDIWLLNLNDRGDITWHKSLGGSDIDRPFDIIIDGDNLVIACASSSKDGDFQKFSNISAGHRLINLTSPACNYKTQSVDVQQKTKSTSGRIILTTNLPTGKGRVSFARIKDFNVLSTFNTEVEIQNGIFTLHIDEVGTYSHFVVKPAESACTLTDYREIEIKEVEEVCDFSKFVLKSASGSFELCKGSFLTLRVDIPYSGCKVTKYEWFKDDVKQSSIQDFQPVMQPGKYAVIIYDSDNKSYNLAPVTISEKECNTGTTTLTATISSPATTVYAPNAIILTANSGTGYTYQWRRNGTNIAGATGATYEAKDSGTYTVVITANGQSVTSNSIVLTVQVPLATEPEISGIEVSVFPNPAEREVNAEIRLGEELPVRVEIYTREGKKLKQWHSESRSFVHRPVISLGSGLEGQQLLMKVSTDKSFVTKKIFVK